MALQREVLWKPLIVTVAGLIIASILTYQFNKPLSVILVLAALGLLSRIPPGLSTYLNPLEMISFFGMVLAISYGPLYGGIFAFLVFMFSRLFLPNEWPMYTIKWSITIGIGAAIAYLIFPIIGSISTVVTVMIIWEAISYTFILTPLLEREAFALELYYNIMLMPIVILHRLVIAFIGGEFLHELLLTGSPKISYLYVFAAIFTVVLWFGKDIIKRLNDFANKNGTFDSDKHIALNNLLKKTGFSFGEAKGIIVSVLALSLALTAGQWGDKVFSALDGIKNLFIAIPAVALSFIAHEKAHKWAAQSQGGYAQFKPYWPMIAFSAVIGIISGGWVIVTSVGAWALTSLKRIGFKHPFIGMPVQAKIAFAGPFVSLLLAITAKMFIGLFGETRLLQDLFTFNLWMTFFNLIPLAIPQTQGTGAKNVFPPFDGAYVFAGNPLLYAGFIGFAVVTVLGLVFLPAWASFILGGIAGIAAWAMMHGEGKVNVLPR